MGGSRRAVPLSESTALCGPKVLAHALNITIPEAQALSKWQASKGTEPRDMVSALRKSGYKAVAREHCTVELLIEFKEAHSNPIIILDYWDDNFRSADGHYVIFLGLDKDGDIVVWNPDFDTESMTMIRGRFELNWFDYKIDDNGVIYKRMAIMAYKGEK